jgi:hypothetical protein
LQFGENFRAAPRDKKKINGVVPGPPSPCFYSPRYATELWLSGRPFVLSESSTWF